MSASLVGSEMCIRDRLARAEIARAATEAEAEQLKASAKPLAIRPPQRPVSYTHLTLPTICSV
eukprot:12953622-Alexandrium_andersonii.AAC.1